MSVCGEGVAVDVFAAVGDTNVRVLGIVSAAHPPEQWNDDELPEIDGYFREVALHTSEFWIGLFASIPYA